MRTMKTLTSAVVASLLALTGLSGCSSSEVGRAVDKLDSSGLVDDLRQKGREGLDSLKNESAGSGADDSTNSQSGESESTHGQASDAQAVGNYEATEWNPSTAPEYYIIAGQAVRSALDTAPKAPGVTYAGVDANGRVGRASALISKQMRDEGSKRKRNDLPDPAGYKGNNQRVEIPAVGGGKPYKGYFYNRSHMVAKSLGGEDELENLVTGTRMQNVGMNDSSNPGGMAFTETEARDWLDKNPTGTIQYVVTNAYVGSEIMPRSTFVDIRSSDGSIDQHVEVFNAAMGYTIDYNTGKWSKN